MLQLKAGALLLIGLLLVCGASHLCSASSEQPETGVAGDEEAASADAAASAPASASASGDAPAAEGAEVEPGAGTEAGKLDTPVLHGTEYRGSWDPIGWLITWYQSKFGSAKPLLKFVGGEADELSHFAGRLPTVIIVPIWARVVARTLRCVSSDRPTDRPTF